MYNSTRTYFRTTEGRALEYCKVVTYKLYRKLCYASVQQWDANTNANKKFPATNLKYI